jgi:hypothetical protein
LQKNKKLHEEFSMISRNFVPKNPPQNFFLPLNRAVMPIMLARYRGQVTLSLENSPSNFLYFAALSLSVFFCLAPVVTAHGRWWQSHIVGAELMSEQVNENVELLRRVVFGRDNGWHFFELLINGAANDFGGYGVPEHYPMELVVRRIAYAFERYNGEEQFSEEFMDAFRAALLGDDNGKEFFTNLWLAMPPRHGNGRYQRYLLNERVNEAVEKAQAATTRKVERGDGFILIGASTITMMPIRWRKGSHHGKEKIYRSRSDDQCAMLPVRIAGRRPPRRHQ